MTTAVEVDISTHRFHAHDAYRTGPRTLRVGEVRPLTGGVVHLRLLPVDSAPLTSYRPGSHLIVTAGEHRNAYSLVDDGINPDSYGISVLRRGAGGGSDWIHDHLAVGDLVEIEGPRSMFAPVLDQRHALLVAGGIGVTPVLSHARALARLGGSAEIVYSHRPGHDAHLEDLEHLCSAAGFPLHVATTVERTTALLTERLADQPLGAHAYACGPPAMLEAYQRLAAGAGWVGSRVHLERFTAPERDPGSPFTAVISSTGRRLRVDPGISLLTALLDAGVPVPHLCRQGVCGECRIPVRADSLEHRDLVLSDADKGAGDTMLCCVSRGAAGSEIEVLL